VFWRETGMKDDDEDVDAREGACSIETAMLESLGPRAAGQLAGDACCSGAGMALSGGRCFVRGGGVGQGRPSSETARRARLRVDSEIRAWAGAVVRGGGGLRCGG
jgi:hypothetical protein